MNSGAITLGVPAATVQLHVADLTLDLIFRRASRAGRRLTLHPREWDVLVYFAWNRNRPITAAELRRHVWELDHDPQTNSVAVHRSRLRDAVDRDFDQPLIHTIRRGSRLNFYLFTDQPQVLEAWGSA